MELSKHAVQIGSPQISPVLASSNARTHSRYVRLLLGVIKRKTSTSVLVFLFPFSQVFKLSKHTVHIEFPQSIPVLASSNARTHSRYVRLLLGVIKNRGTHRVPLFFYLLWQMELSKHAVQIGLPQKTPVLASSNACTHSR